MPALVPLPAHVRRREVTRVMFTLLGASAVCLAMVVTHESWSQLFTEQGLRHALTLFSGFLEPDFGPEFLGRVLVLLAESFAIGFAGLFFALTIGIPLALLGARLPALPYTPEKRSVFWPLLYALRPVARFTLTWLRSVPEIIWAFIFVRIFGLGPGPAVMAIGLTFGGIIGKLFAELMESAPVGAGRSLRASGCSAFAVAVYGVLPQVRHQWLGYGLFRLECAVRSASVLGVVGAGGIGSEIQLSIRYFQYDKLATSLLAVLGAIVLLELMSMRLRAKPVAGSLGLLTLGMLIASQTLQVRWSQLFSWHSISQVGVFASGFLKPTMDLPFVLKALESMGETMVMAAFATTLAALIAGVLAPFAARQLSWLGYLQSWGQQGFIRSGPFLGMWLLVRFFYQVLRAVPDLVWALLFVVWVGAGPVAGTLAVAIHTTGILGRLFGEVYEDIDASVPRTLEAMGNQRFAVWAYGVLPQAVKPLLAFTLFRFEVNVRATAMVGFLGAGGIGDAIHTAVSLFHFADLATLLMVLIMAVAVIDSVSSTLRTRMLKVN